MATLLEYEPPRHTQLSAEQIEIVKAVINRASAEPGVDETRLVSRIMTHDSGNNRSSGRGLSALILEMVDQRVQWLAGNRTAEETYQHRVREMTKEFSHGGSGVSASDHTRYAEAVTAAVEEVAAERVTDAVLDAPHTVEVKAGKKTAFIPINKPADVEIADTSLGRTTYEGRKSMSDARKDQLTHAIKFATVYAFSDPHQDLGIAVMVQDHAGGAYQLTPLLNTLAEAKERQAAGEAGSTQEVADAVKELWKAVSRVPRSDAQKIGIVEGLVFGMDDAIAKGIGMADGQIQDGSGTAKSLQEPVHGKHS